eukprot:5059330-Prymnesium_polylepis.1
MPLHLWRLEPARECEHYCEHQCERARRRRAQPRTTHKALTNYTRAPPHPLTCLARSCILPQPPYAPRRAQRACT